MSINNKWGNGRTCTDMSFQGMYLFSFILLFKELCHRLTAYLVDVFLLVHYPTLPPLAPLDLPFFATINVKSPQQLLFTATIIIHMWGCATKFLEQLCFPYTDSAVMLHGWFYGQACFYCLWVKLPLLPIHLSQHDKLIIEFLL